MRLQGSAGNAAVAGLMRGRAGVGRFSRETAPDEGDSALMSAMAGERSLAREPVVIDEMTVPVEPNGGGGPVVLDEMTVPVEPKGGGPVVIDEMTIPVEPAPGDGTVVMPEETIKGEAAGGRRDRGDAGGDDHGRSRRRATARS